RVGLSNQQAVVRQRGELQARAGRQLGLSSGQGVQRHAAPVGEGQAQADLLSLGSLGSAQHLGLGLLAGSEQSLQGGERLQCVGRQAAGGAGGAGQGRRK